MKRYLIVMLLTFVVIACEKPLFSPVRHVSYSPFGYYPSGKFVVDNINLNYHYEYYGWDRGLLYVSSFAKPLYYPPGSPRYYEIVERIRRNYYAVISFNNTWGNGGDVYVWPE